MPNWCRNEIKFQIYSFDGSSLFLEVILDFLKETIPNYHHRIKIAKAVHEKRSAELNSLDRVRWDFFDEKIEERGIFDFNNLIPYPKEFKERDDDAQLLSGVDFLEKYGDNKDGFNSGGYEWCNKHWKTKWGPSNVLWVKQQHTFYFDTAWGPSIPIVSELHKRFPEVHIQYEYYEKGSGFIGGCEFVPEDDWSPNDFTSEEAHSIEQHLKGFGPEPDSKWEAGKAYNPWVGEYMGFKGG